MSLTSISQTSLSGILTADVTIVKVKFLFLILDYNYFDVDFFSF